MAPQVPTRASFWETVHLKRSKTTLVGLATCSVAPKQTYLMSMKLFYSRDWFLVHVRTCSLRTTQTWCVQTVSLIELGCKQHHGRVYFVFILGCCVNSYVHAPDMVWQCWKLGFDTAGSKKIANIHVNGLVPTKSSTQSLQLKTLGTCSKLLLLLLLLLDILI